jgi:Predicted endonuclease containing a URI domain
MQAFYVYMMTNRSRVVLYTGITNSLTRRVWQHQNGEIEGFTKTYEVNLSSITSAITILATRLRGKRKSKAGVERRRMP